MVIVFLDAPGAGKGAQQAAQKPKQLYLRGSTKGNSASSSWSYGNESSADDAAPYRLDSGDRLRVVGFDQENLSRTYSVDGSGHISMPLIGAVRARGATTYELEERIAAKLRDEYVKDPKVTVEIQTYRPFFILGEVREPGQFPYVNGMTVQTAVAIAGGYTERAREGKVKLTRHVDGRSAEFTVPGNYRVRPGDTIYVEERLF
jgi:polysaccharide export outer membrane protein